MAIFLHFLNREIYRAVNAEFSVSRASQWLRILTVGTAEPLVSNFANLLEGGYLASGDAALFRALLSRDQLLIVGERPSLREYLDSRRLRYGFDASRYPMYFSGQAGSDLEPSYVRPVSATTYLADQIEAIARHEIGLSTAVSHRPDLPLVNEALHSIARIVRERDSSAITRSLFAGRIGSEAHESATSRLISALYVKQHLDECRGDIPTGVRPLIAFEGLGTGDAAHDLALLYAVLSSVGIGKDVFLRQHDDELLANLRGSSRHIEFVRRVALLCRTLAHYLEKKHGSRQFRQYAREMLDAVEGPRRSVCIDGTMYEDADLRLAKIVTQLRSMNQVFAAEFERQSSVGHAGPVVLLVTATKVETQALLKVAEDHGCGVPQYIAKDKYVAMEFGIFNGARLLAVQCEAGSVGPAAAQAVITDAISDFAPHAVILGGIAFGAKTDKQKLGDVLVSKIVVDYERAKVKAGTTIPRGQRIEASPKLISVVRAAEATWHETPVHVGTLLTGEKLIDDKSFIAGLLRLEPEAIGGEMEGAGLVAAAARAKVDWIIVKSIVDWGFEKSTSNNETQQYEAARGAFLFIFWALGKVGL